jgi:acetyltransferase-like isoleucine patch superfamily enzyme
MLFDISKLKKIGKNVTIGEMVKIINPENIEIDDYSRIDDFSIIVGGKGIKIGKFVHIASYTSVIGGGELIMEDFSGTAAGVRIITGSDDYSGKCLTNPTTPIKYRPYATTGKVHLKRHAVVATNVIVYPNVVIGEGSIVGAGSVVNLSLDAWGIYMGYPARKISNRPNEEIYRMEKELLKEITITGN